MSFFFLVGFGFFVCFCFFLVKWEITVKKNKQHNEKFNHLSCTLPLIQTKIL